MCTVDTRRRLANNLTSLVAGHLVQKAGFMRFRQISAVALSAALVVGPFALHVFAQQPGALAGRSRSYRDQNAVYEVRIQNVETNQVVGAMTLAQDRRFSFTGLALPGTFLVVLYDVARDRVVCTEGPYELTSDSLAAAQKTDIVISCGTPAAALWLAALAGATTGVWAATNHSGSN
jgi:hypothetical protein